MGVQVIPNPIEVVSHSIPFPSPIPCFIPIPIPMGFPRDSHSHWESHSHAHLYLAACMSLWHPISRVQEAEGFWIAEWGTRWWFIVDMFTCRRVVFGMQLYANQRQSSSGEQTRIL